MKQQFGLKASDIEEMQQIFKSYAELQKVILFGSRALGNFKIGSDIDLAILCDSDISTKLSTELNQYSKLPYKFDVLNYALLKDSNVKEHIDRYGKPIFKRDNS